MSQSILKHGRSNAKFFCAAFLLRKVANFQTGNPKKQVSGLSADQTE